MLVLKAGIFQTYATYYFGSGKIYTGCPAVQTFQDGNRYGPCFEGVRYTNNSKYWVATNDAEHHCGEQIDVFYENNSVTLMIMDKCPGCGDDHIDMGLDALVELTGSKERACAIHTTLPQISWTYSSDVSKCSV